MKLKSVVVNLALMAVSAGLIVGVAEVASRYMVPISPGPSLLSTDGKPIRQSYVEPGSQYRIITPDFDALTTITKDGYRGPASSGNPDTLFLGDSFTFAQGVTLELSPEQEDAVHNSLPPHKQLISTALKYSNLLRVLYYKVLPEIRQQGDDSGQKEQLEKALAITKESFDRLQVLSDEYAFNYRIFVIYPEPEVRLGVYKQMDEKLQAIAPSEITSLGELFSNDSQQYFFPADGHFTESGNRLLADFLIKEMP